MATTKDDPHNPNWNWGETYSAQLFDDATAHLKVRRHDGKDGISWDVLQRIKNDMLGEEAVAIELYPPEHFVVNEANIRHLWLISEMPPFGMRPLA